MDTAGRRAWERASAGSSAYTRAGPTIPPTQDSECNQVKYSTDLVLRNVDEKQSLGRAAADLKGGRRSCYAVGFDYWANCYDVICSCCSRIRGWISHKQTRIIWPSWPAGLTADQGELGTSAHNSSWFQHLQGCFVMELKISIVLILHFLAHFGGSTWRGTQMRELMT